MNLVATVPAVLAAVGALLLPGLAFVRLLGRSDREALKWDEVAFLVVATGVMVTAWLGLALAELGRFSLITAGAIGAALSAVTLLVRRERRPAARLGCRPRPLELAGVLVVLALSLGLYTRPSEYLVGGRDPGTYVAAMGLIARHGGIVYTDPAVLAIPREAVELFYRNPEGPTFAWGRFMGFPLESPLTGRVFPEFFHLFPVFGAYLFQAMGTRGALATPVVFGLLGSLAVFFATRRLFGAWVALCAGGLLAGNVVQVWFARFPMSEPMSQFLLFTGIWALAHWEERGSTALGALAGVAFGLSLLVRIDSVLLAVPLTAYLVLRRARGDLSWPRAAVVLGPLLVLGLHACVHAWLWSTKYALSIINRPYWRQPAWVWVLAVALVGATLALARGTRPLVVPFARGHETALRRAAVGALLILASYAYFVRPMLSIWAGADGNDPSMAWSDPGWLHALGFQRLAAHDAQSFVRLGWFIHPLGLVLAVAGAAWLLMRGTHRHLFMLLTAFSFSGFYFYKLRVWNDYFFAARRFVPVILPCALILVAVALTRLAAGGRWRRAAAVGLALVLAVTFAIDTRRIAEHVDYRGMVSQVAELGRLFQPDDLVIFENAASIHVLSLPLWALQGTQVLELVRWTPDEIDGNTEKLRQALDVWRQRYHNIYFVYTYRGAPNLCGVFLHRVKDFLIHSVEWERSYVGPPREVRHQSWRFTVSRMALPEQIRVPPLEDLDVGGSDDLQVSGFFPKEGGGDQTYRWTGPCASVYLPALRNARAVILVAAAARRPEPATVRVSLDGRLVGTFVPGPDWAEFRIALPEGRTSGEGLLRLDVPTWRPDNVLEDSSDVRDLGIMLDRVHVVR